MKFNIFAEIIFNGESEPLLVMDRMRRKIKSQTIESAIQHTKEVIKRLSPELEKEIAEIRLFLYPYWSEMIDKKEAIVRNLKYKGDISEKGICGG